MISLPTSGNSLHGNKIVECDKPKFFSDMNGESFRFSTRSSGRDDFHQRVCINFAWKTKRIYKQTLTKLFCVYLDRFHTEKRPLGARIASFRAKTKQRFRNPASCLPFLQKTSPPNPRNASSQSLDWYSPSKSIQTRPWKSCHHRSCQKGEIFPKKSKLVVNQRPKKTPIITYAIRNSASPVDSKSRKNEYSWKVSSSFPSVSAMEKYCLKIAGATSAIHKALKAWKLKTRFLFFFTILNANRAKEIVWTHAHFAVVLNCSILEKVRKLRRSLEQNT